MKKKPFLFAFLLLLFFAFKSDEQKAVNFFDEDWSGAVAAAKAQNKPIFAFVYGATCQVSAKMRGNTLKDEDVVKELNEKFVCVKLCADETKNNLRVTMWGVEAVPTYVFFTKNKKKITIDQGFKNPEEMVEMAEDALKQMNSNN